MKSRFLIIVLLLASVCLVRGEEKNVSRVIEQTVLWKVELDDRWVPVEMNTLVNDPALFTQSGNFYKAKTKISVFGHELIYAGMLGVEFCPGPNVTLRGRPKRVKAAIEKAHGLKFEAVEGGYVLDLKKDIKLIVMRHPEKWNQTIVIGGYFGP